MKKLYKITYETLCLSDAPDIDKVKMEGVQYLAEEMDAMTRPIVDVKEMTSNDPLPVGWSLDSLLWHSDRDDISLRTYFNQLKNKDQFFSFAEHAFDSPEDAAIYFEKLNSMCLIDSMDHDKFIVTCNLKNCSTLNRKNILSFLSTENPLPTKLELFHDKLILTYDKL